MGTDTLVSTKRITESRDLKPGDVITQEYLDVNKGVEAWAARDIRLDRIASGYLAHVRDGRTFLSPVLTLHGWDVRKGRGVLLTCTPERVWDTVRIS